MKFLVDQNLSRRLAEALTEAGYGAVHASDYGMQRASDEQIMIRARDDGRIVLSADTDFGSLLARTRASSPSFVLVRRLTGRRVAEQAELLVANLPAVERDLELGAVVVVGEDRLRVRRLPLVPLD